jgi:hypothetical protein
VPPLAVVCEAANRVHSEDVSGMDSWSNTCYDRPGPSSFPSRNGPFPQSLRQSAGLLVPALQAGRAIP